MPKHRETHVRRHTLASFSLCAVAPLYSIALLCAACSGETLDLGNNTGELSAASSACDLPTDFGDNVVVFNQADIDRLAGCETLPNLFVVPFENPDFTPLASLVRIEGEAELGHFNLPNDIASDEVEPFTDELFRLLASGWLNSLEGFDALEQIGNVRLNGLGVSSLQPLSNLRALTDGGLLEISGCTALRDLEGLENLAGVFDLNVDCETLESLRGLNFPDVMRGVSIGAPLTDLGAFDVSRLDAFSLGGTALTHLDGLASLGAADSVSLTANFALVNADGLDRLSGTLDLSVVGNLALETLPDFPNVQSLKSLQVLANNALRNLPAFPGILEALESDPELPPPPFRFNADLIRISANERLEALTLPRALASASVVAIDTNPALKSIAFSDVVRMDELSLTDNPALESVDLGALERVASLSVVNSPLLSPTAFDGVQVAEAPLAGAP